MDYGIRIFKLFNKTDPDLKYAFDIYVKEHVNSSTNILFAQIGDLSYGDLNVTLNMRDSEKIISIDDCPGLSDNEDYQTVKFYIPKYYQDTWKITYSIKNNKYNYETKINN